MNRLRGQMNLNKGMTKMTIEKLEYFYTIAKYNSISKAASELHVSKSTLSASLKDLESELGHLLFNQR